MHVRINRDVLVAMAMFGCSAIAMVAAVVPAPAAAQGFNSISATGRVVDANGKPIGGARLTIHSVDQGFNRSAVTNEAGAYSVPELPQGAYDFTVEADGYRTYTETKISLTPGQSGNQFALTATDAATGAKDEEVVVTGRRTATSAFDLTTTGAVINVADVSARLPVARNIQALIQLAPGTTVGSGAFNNLSSFNGGAVSENAFFVNGLNITDFRKGLAPADIPYDFYQTIEVKTGGYAAEYGRSTGGFVSATTKSGSNEFHGGILFTGNPNGLRSRTPDTLSSYNRGGYSDAEATIFQLSGPIIKNHLFFYGLAQISDNSSIGAGRQFLGDPRNASQVNDPAQYIGTSRSFYNASTPLFGAKIDAVITDGQRLEFTYFNTKGTGATSYYGDTTSLATRYNLTTGADGAYSGGLTSRFGGANYVGRYTGVFSRWLTASAAYGRNENNSDAIYFNANNSIVAGVTDARDPLNNKTLVNGGGYTTINHDVRKFYRGDVDLFFNLFASHHIKFGYDREDLSSLSGFTIEGNGYRYTILRARSGNPYGLAPGTDYVNTVVDKSSGSFTSENEAFYVQDSMSMLNDRVKLNVGLRDDRFTNDNALKQTFYKSGNQWGPRIGFTADPLGDQTDKVYGSFSRLFVPVASNTNIRLTGGELYYTRTNLFAGLDANNQPILGAPVLYPNAAACPDTGTLSCLVTGTGKPVSTEAAVAKGLRPQSVDEFQLGYEKRLGSHWRVGAFLTYTRLRDTLEDAGIDQAVRKYCAAQNISGCANIWDGYHQYVLINPGYDATVTLSDPLPGESKPRTITLTAQQLALPHAVRTYKGVTMEAHRDWDGVWSLDASYTYSKTLGNYEGGVKTDNGQSDTGLTTDFDSPGNTLGTYGYSPNDRRHVVKMAGNYLFRGVNIGLNLQVYSPRHFGCIGFTPVDIDPYSGAGGLFCQINSDGSINTDPTVTQPLKLVQRGSVFQSDWLFINNLDLAYNVKIAKATFFIRGSVFNILNRKAKLNFNENGTDGQGVASPYYRTVSEYQGGRNVRFQIGMNF